jgi:hypothetical protein
VTHNGVVIVDATAQAFPELGRRYVNGYLGLQNHNEEVWFRNLRIGPPQPAVEYVRLEPTRQTRRRFQRGR